MSAPFDPIALKEAEKNKLRIVIMDGKNITNINDYLDDKKFVGTIIE